MIVATNIGGDDYSCPSLWLVKEFLTHRRVRVASRREAASRRVGAEAQRELEVDWVEFKCYATWLWVLGCVTLYSTYKI